jgi:hypothetical protein
MTRRPSPAPTTGAATCFRRLAAKRPRDDRPEDLIHFERLRSISGDDQDFRHDSLSFLVSFPSCDPPHGPGANLSSGLTMSIVRYPLTSTRVPCAGGAGRPEPGLGWGGTFGRLGGRQVTEHLEIEQKFDVTLQFERPDFGALSEACGEPVTAVAPVLYQLSATYFDTADERLAASKITLRRRTGGTDAGWHLKLPSPGPAAAPGDGSSVRLEVHAPLTASGERDVPETLVSRVAEVTGGLPLSPIAALHTERTVVTITATDGRVLAEIADDLVTASRIPAPEGSAPLRWREIEVEVPGEAPRLQRAAAELLFAAGAKPAGHGSKLARVLSTSDTTGP